MKTIAIVQARVGSTRLPNKVMQLINNVPMIELLLKRLSKANCIDRIVLATSTDHRNLTLVDHVRELGFDVYQGSEDDVLDRYYQTAKLYMPDTIVRITGDCPLIDPQVVDSVITAFKKTDRTDYACNVNPPTYPDGLDAEVFTYSALETAWLEARNQYDREHVTSYIRETDCFNVLNVPHEKDYSSERWTVDEREDFEVVKSVFAHFLPRIDFSWQEVLQLSESHPELFSLNQHINRNEGAILNTGQKLWKRAKHIIPGGNMLLSKRAEMFLPNQWPTYFSKAKGCKVWDLDGNEYIDMSLMGVGTNILGYGHPEVDHAVKQTVMAGNMSTLNCSEEVYLAEKLIEIHPWADMVRFARSGGEANAITIRIARSASGKDKVAICGYHGWHDWYLSANLADNENLAGHLLPDLKVSGVPQNLKETVHPFKYNNFAELEALVNDHDIGVIMMEVSRNEEPKDNFLKNVRQLAIERGIVLIFDECTSGFRETNGGLHKKYCVEPDIAVFGKALGNGYTITAVIGKREVMEAAQSSFISSTFWTERIGPTAALATLDVMENIKSWESITKTGLNIRKGWEQLAEKHNLKIKNWGLPALAGFTFENPNALIYKTLISQEMLKKGYLASNSVYACTEHTKEVVEGYFDALDPIFEVIKDCEEGLDVKQLIKGPICHAGFKRLN